MTTQYYSGPNYFGRFLGFLLALLLGATGLAVFVRHATAGRLGRMATRITGQAPAFDASVPAVVEKIQRLSRLETVVYSLDTVVEGERSADPAGCAGGRSNSAGGAWEVDCGDRFWAVEAGGRAIDSGTRSIHVTLPASQLL